MGCACVGLALISGHLLLLAPEEDAFWILISIMDSHLRPYFSPVTTQLEVDSALFSRALEQNDAPLAKKVYVEMGISPPAICLPWSVSGIPCFVSLANDVCVCRFSSLFVGSLPTEYLNRVWDLFLFEGT